MFNYVPKLCLNNLEASKRDKFTIATLSFFIRLFEIPKQTKSEQQKHNIFFSTTKLLHASSGNKFTSNEKQMLLGVHYCFRTLMIQ